MVVKSDLGLGSIEEGVVSATNARVKLFKRRLGPWKFKDKPGRRAYEIQNSAEEYFVVRKIVVAKLPGKNNEMIVELLMPDEKQVEVVIKEAKKVKGRRS